jgi:hypothetical protein
MMLSMWGAKKHDKIESPFVANQKPLCNKNIRAERGQTDSVQALNMSTR